MSAARTTDRQLWWMLGAIALVLLVALGLRYGTNVLQQSETYDERFIRVPIDNLLERGWSVETAIDYEETKGPVMIWTYALAGEILGADLNDLRITSVLLFWLSALPLTLIARRCGLRRWSLILVAALYVLLPYHAMLAQLVMSEASFMFGSLWLAWVFFWGFHDGDGREKRVMGPLLFGILLAVLLHHRIHAVAFAGAACLIALERDLRSGGAGGDRSTFKWQSWPWWLACALAGASRLWLWQRWGGLVSPYYQGQHDVGFTPQNLTYLAAAYAPFTAIFLWPVIARAELRRRWALPALGAAFGVVLALFARPDLRDGLPFYGSVIERYLGLVASSVRAVSDDPSLQQPILCAIAIVGTTSMGALASIAWGLPRATFESLVCRYTVWALLTGWGMYCLTNSSVFDRYVLPWGALLPIVWALALPRKAAALQGLMMLAVLVWVTWAWLIAPPKQDPFIRSDDRPAQPAQREVADEHRAA